MPHLHRAAAVQVSAIAGRGVFARTDMGTGSAVVFYNESLDPPTDLGPVNHSCDPNLGWRDDRTLATTRDVTAGEELTVDYATLVDDPDFVMMCHCENYRCRQVIEGTDWRIPQLQTRYAGRWHPQVQRRIDAGAG